MNSRARSPVVAKQSAAALRRYLKRVDMSQAQLGKMGGWSAPTVSRWFRGEFPTDEQKAVIAKITNGEVQPNDWFKGLPKKRRPNGPMEEP
jgi:transcriptional regulator with XRE-family HTH domain